MPKTFNDWLCLSAAAACGLSLLAIGAVSVCLFGFAWAVLITVTVAVMIGRFFPTGNYGEGAYVISFCWMLLAVGVAVGLVLRVLGAWLG